MWLGSLTTEKMKDRKPKKKIVEEKDATLIREVNASDQRNKGRKFFFERSQKP
jgi:hypothetical protein